MIVGDIVRINRRHTWRLTKNPQDVDVNGTLVYCNDDIEINGRWGDVIATVLCTLKVRWHHGDVSRHEFAVLTSDGGSVVVRAHVPCWILGDTMFDEMPHCRT